MKNELFHYLTSRGIFKGNSPTLKASEKTEQRRMERNRGRLIWLALGYLTDPVTKLRKKIGRGTYVIAKHGLINSRHA
jgi:hypothetical protein